MYFIDGYCGDLYPIVALIKLILKLIKFVVPIALILFITIDLVKALVSGSEDEMKKSQKVVLKRAVYALAVFLAFTAVDFTMSLIADAGVKDLANNPVDVQSWKACWGCSSKNTCGYLDAGITGVCCATSSGTTQTFTWYPDRNTCTNGFDVDLSKGSCNGTAPNATGRCCTKNNVKIWQADSIVCPSGYNELKNVGKNDCGVCCASYSDGFQKYEWKTETGTCSSGFATDKSKSSCNGSVPAKDKGVCCQKAGTTKWQNNSLVCPSGYKIVSGVDKELDCRVA